MIIPKHLHPALLQAMYRQAFVSPWAAIHGTLNTVPTLEECEERLKRYPYVDYFQQRCIKTKFTEDAPINFALYNRDAGEGVGERIAAELIRVDTE